MTGTLLIVANEEHATDDKNIIQGFHRDDLDSFPLFDGYPSHLHIDLLPKAQGNQTSTHRHPPIQITSVLPLGQGHGTRMIRHIESELKQRGSTGVHLGELSTDCSALLESLLSAKAWHPATLEHFISTRSLALKCSLNRTTRSGWANILLDFCFAAHRLVSNRFFFSKHSPTMFHTQLIRSSVIGCATAQALEERPHQSVEVAS